MKISISLHVLSFTYLPKIPFLENISPHIPIEGSYGGS